MSFNTILQPGINAKVLTELRPGVCITALCQVNPGHEVKRQANIKPGESAIKWGSWSLGPGWESVWHESDYFISDESRVNIDLREATDFWVTWAARPCTCNDNSWESIALGPEQNGQQHAGDILKNISLWKLFFILIHVSLKFALWDNSTLTHTMLKPSLGYFYRVFPPDYEKGGVFIHI